MYESVPPAPMTSDDAIEAYAVFLRDLDRFEAALGRVLKEWPLSCEHFLSNDGMNRLAWLGQASMCIATRVPACFRGGFHRLSEGERGAANEMARKWLLVWRRSRPQGDIFTDACEKDAATESDVIPLSGDLWSRASQYVKTWMGRGYEDGIPDEVPTVLAAQHLAPSYRALCIAILKNDHGLLSLGGIPKESKWYGALKRIEIAARTREPERQMDMFQ